MYFIDTKYAHTYSAFMYNILCFWPYRDCKVKSLWNYTVDNEFSEG